jgi:ATP/ADP translocase/HEAT repeat protein
MKVLRELVAVRPAEQRDAWTAFVTLFATIACLALLETARDALFLSRLPVSQLPWMYILLAAVSLVAARFHSRVQKFNGRVALSFSMILTGGVTVILTHWLKPMGPGAIYTLYVWTSVSTALLVVRFWTLLATRFTVTQAKRLYGLIGAGSVLGAIAGTALARGLAMSMSPRHLAQWAGIGFMVASVLPLAFTRDKPRPVEGERESFGAVRGAMPVLARQPYALRLVLAMSVSTACVTVGDYLFKSTTAELVPRHELASWLATVYFILNVGSLFVQLFVTGWLTRRASVPAVFAVLPLLLFAGGMGAVITAGFASVLLIKGADGMLRYSLHKTTSEMLYLPFTDAARQRVKMVIDVVGQRGGQAVASLAVLGITALGGSTRSIAAAVLVLAVVWIVTAALLRPGYISLFRGRLGPSVEHLGAFPELDLASLETLIATLDSKNDNEVLAALDALEREGRARLVPALILHHPSEAVVERALALFTRARRTNVLPTIDRLLDHPSPRVRAAALAARAALGTDPQPLLLRAGADESPEVRATITVNLIARGEIYGDDARERLHAILAQGRPHAKVALADAIGARGAIGFADTLIALGQDDDADVRQAAARAMNAVRDPQFVPIAIEMLPNERTRGAARELLVGLGDVALDALVGALREPNRTPTLRWRIAQVIPAFEEQAAARALLTLLTREDDGAVRFQIIRGLEGLVRRHPELTLDRAILLDAVDATIRRAFRYLGRRVSLERGAVVLNIEASPGRALLKRVLDDKTRNAVDRLFRLLGLWYPLEDFVAIHRGIESGAPDARASAVELVANLLPQPVRGAVVGLVDELTDDERLAAAGPFRAKVPAQYGDLLDELLGSTSESVRSVAVFHVGELGLTRFQGRLQAMLEEDAGLRNESMSDAARVLERIAGVRVVPT